MTTMMKCNWCGMKSNLTDDETEKIEDKYNEWLAEHEFTNCPNYESFWVKGISPEGDNFQLIVEAWIDLAAHLQNRMDEGWEVIMNDNGNLHIAKEAVNVNNND